MRGKNTIYKQETGQPILFIELGLRQTKAISAIITEHGPVAKSCSVDQPFLLESAGEVRLDPASLRNFLAKQPCPRGDVVLVIDPSVTMKITDKVPQTTASTIHEHVRQSVSKSEKLDLSAYSWTVTPLSLPQGHGQELTASSFEERSVVVSAAKRSWLDAAQSQILSAGWKVNRVLFHQACVIRAFQLFGGAAFEKETVGLLHLSETRYSLALLQNELWIANRDGQVRGTEKLKTDIKAYLSGNVARLRIQVRCLFVSVDGKGAEWLVNELKEVGCYARTWNALRKITVENSEEDSPAPDGAQFNALVGAMLIATDCSQAQSANEEPDGAPIWEKAERCLARPLKMAACIAAGGALYFGYLNAEARSDLRVLQQLRKQEQQQLDNFRTAKDNTSKRVAELELFRSSRKSWPGVVSQIRSINVPGVSVSQIKVSDNLSVPDSNPFEAARGTQYWRNFGAMVVEAKNEGGLSALEQFMNAIKGNGYIRPLLHKKKPARILNNIDIEGEETPYSLFTVEYPLHERIL